MIPVESIEEPALVLRQAFACFPTGVTAVCAVTEAGPVGMAVSSFSSVSLDPPLLSVCMQNGSATWPVLRRRAHLGLSVLAEHQAAAGRRLSTKDCDRFAELEWEADAGGALFVLGATAWFDCSVHAEVPAGDHTVVLLLVHGLDTRPEIAPLVFHGSRFRRLDDTEPIVGA